MRRVALACGLAAVLGLAAAGVVFAIRSTGSPSLVRRPAPQLITNEYAYRHPDSPDSVRSPDWLVTSGSLYRIGNLLWSGRPDDNAPGPVSALGTGSAVLRAVTTRSDLRDVRVRFALHAIDLTRTPRTPPRAYDGVHVFLRYQSERSTYYVSVYRRDGHVVVKKKTAGGPSNGGTYTTLATATVDASAAAWRHIEVTIAGSAGSSVVLALRVDGHPTLEAVDREASAITAPGRAGLRGDNCEFFVRDFTVEQLAAP